MIPVHRIKGDQLFVNADLIESIEVSAAGQGGASTVLMLVDGRKAIVVETPEEIVGLIRAYRASIIVEAEQQRSSQHTGPNLRVVRGDEI